MGLLQELNLGGMLEGALGQVAAGQGPNLINALLARTQFGDLNGLVGQLQQSGLQTQVQSWLGPGANMPITADQLKSVLSNSQVQEMARHLGLPVDAAMNMLAQHLPNAVDQASKNGQMQPSN